MMLFSLFILTHLWLIYYMVVQLYYINFLFSRSLTSFVVGGRMAQDGAAGGADNFPPPPPVHPALLEILRRSEESQQAQNQII